MYLQKALIVLSTIIAIVSIGITIQSFIQLPPSPKVDENAYWGLGKQPLKEDTSIKPFKIAVPDELLKDLRIRLENTRPLTPPLEGIQQQYGLNTNLLQKVVDYWKNSYNWRKSEVLLNQFPQFKTKIQGLNIHYIHVKPKSVRSVPLLILNGWPNSIRGLLKIISVLATAQKERDFSFEVIAPSLPGFGFSDGSSKVGFGPLEMASVMKNLMKRIGHENFYVQGGDWGSVIVTYLAVLYPENVLGLHSTLCFAVGTTPYSKILLGSIYPPLIVQRKYEDRMYPLSKFFDKAMEETGYFHIQATKPDTIGVAVSQSPVGLAAYILEKFSTGTNYTYKTREDGGLLDKFTYDELLDNIMIYWITNSFTTSVRIYAEAFTKAHLAKRMLEMPIKEEVPCACARFAYEIIYNTDWILKDKYKNLIQTTDLDVGGHFSAFEEPVRLAQDIFSAVEKMERLRKRKQ